MSSPPTSVSWRLCLPSGTSRHTAPWSFFAPTWASPTTCWTRNLKLNKKEIAKIEALPAEEQEAARAAALEKAAKDRKKLSLSIVADKLNELLGGGVVFATDTVGADAQAKVAAMKPGDIVLLENTRFTAAEEKNDPEFSRKLAAFAEIFVNDAFGTAHRAHASTAGVVQYAGLPAVCGYRSV